MNKVFVNNDDIIEIVVVGDQTVESVSLMADQAQQLIAKKRRSGEPALILDNLLDIGEVPTDARKSVVAKARSADFDKLAMVGDQPMVRLGANLMLQAIGKSKKVRYFQEYDLAIKWLNR